jgi:NAD(P)-dependent dehydrogenase (short-subunit alcohol dehydrogenase family)
VSCLDGRPPGASLTGSAAFVTGAARGLGRDIAAALHGAGAAVVLAGRDQRAVQDAAARIDPSASRTLAVRCDVTSQQDMAAAVEAALAAFGRIDTLVCNSGVAGPTRQLWATEPAEWRETIEVNVMGAFHTCRAALPAMTQSGRGSVVLIGSMTAKRVLHGRSSYMASKSALIGLVRALAAECGPYGVRANLVSPGAIEGPRMDGVFAAQAALRGITAEQARAEMISAAPLGRLVSANDVARVVTFLASDAASAITGEDLNVSAGLVMY